MSRALPFLLILGLASTAPAKAPTLEHLYPAGGAKGTTVAVTATGQFERWPVQTWTSSPGLTVTPLAEKGKLSVAIGPGVEPGLHWIRLYDEQGTANPRPFLVGFLPEVNEIEPNDEPAKAQPIAPAAATVNGQLIKNGDVDGYRVTLRKGQTLVADLEANRTLGSPMDAVLQVATPQGFVLAQNDDAPDRDPQIVFEAPKDGDYVVRVFAFPFVQESSIRFSGNPSYVYRLTLATTGFADHAWPLSLPSGESGSVEAVGWNISEASRRLMLTPSEDPTTFAWHPSLANPVEVRRVDQPSVLEIEPNDRSHPQALGWPVALSGRIDPPGDRDFFTFEARKGETLILEVDSRGLGRPLDAVLRVSDAAGATIVEVDDARKAVDPEVRFNPPADGLYRASVHDLNRHGGPGFAYLLTIDRPRPDFTLSIPGDPIRLKPGEPFELKVKVDRREGFAEPIEIGLADRYDGVITEPVVSKKAGATAGSVTLRLRGCECVRPGSVQIVGQAEGGRRKFALVPVAGLSRSIDSTWITLVKPEPPKPEAKNAPPAK